jgi:hypothetical protein
VDLYAPATIAISWTTPNNSVYGYFFHLDSLSASSTFLLGVRVCKPYTVVKWHEGQAAILNGACAENGVNWRRNASLLLEGQRLFLPFNGERISAIRRDPTSRRIYVYKPPVLYVYSPDTYERITAYRMPELRDFYVSRSSIFYIVGTKVCYGQVNVNVNKNFRCESTMSERPSTIHLARTMHHVGSLCDTDSMMPT